MAGTGYSQLYSLSLMEKLLSRLAPPPQQSGTTLANAGLCLLLLCISLKHTSFYTTSLARSSSILYFLTETKRESMEWNLFQSRSSWRYILHTIYRDEYFRYMVVWWKKNDTLTSLGYLIWQDISLFKSKYWKITY